MQKDGEEGSFENTKMRLTRNMFILMVCRFVSSVSLFFFFFYFHYIRHLILILDDGYLLFRFCKECCSFRIV